MLDESIACQLPPTNSPHPHAVLMASPCSATMGGSKRIKCPGGKQQSKLTNTSQHNGRDGPCMQASLLDLGPCPNTMDLGGCTTSPASPHHHKTCHTQPTQGPTSDEGATLVMSGPEFFIVIFCALTRETRAEITTTKSTQIWFVGPT
jgi:hypothetical protein